MSEYHQPDHEEEAPSWQHESYYFSNACWPSDVSYRRDGERLQVQIEMVVPVTYSITSSTAEVRLAPDVLAQLSELEEVTLTLDTAERYTLTYVRGWAEVTTEEGRQQYADDVRVGLRSRC